MINIRFNKMTKQNADALQQIKGETLDIMEELDAFIFNLPAGERMTEFNDASAYLSDALLELDNATAGFAEPLAVFPARLFETD
jgi:hypothetical protein